MGINFSLSWEVPFMVWLQSVLGEWFTPVASFITMFGEEIVLIAVIGFLYWCYDKEYGKFVGINIMAAESLNGFVKNIIRRRRPYMDNPGIECRKPVEEGADIMNVNAQGYSCPSGHSANASSLFGSLAYYKKKKVLTWICSVIIILVGCSRVVLGVHYPTDVLLGWTLGLVVMFITSALQKKIKKSWIVILIVLICLLPGWFFCTSHDYFTSYGVLIGMMLAFPVEEKFVRFENTKNAVRIVLRVLGGLLIYFGLNTLLKMPFSEAVLDADNFIAHLIRAGRYGLIIFIELAVYPMLFKVTAGFGKKK